MGCCKDNCYSVAWIMITISNYTNDLMAKRRTMKHHSTKSNQLKLITILTLLASSSPPAL